MNALILGGQSPRHKQWVREVSQALRPHFDQVRLLDYAHWDRGGTEVDLEYEITQAAQLARGLDEYVIMAKSIGTVVASLANARGLLAPKRCVFMGFPLKVVRELPQAQEVAAALKTLPPAVFVHNQDDPLSGAADVQAYIAANAPARYSFRVVPNNDTHDYVDFALIEALAAGSS